MICTEQIGDRVYTYSDAGVKILQNETGIVYEDALDVPESGYTYTETDIAIEDELTDSEALNIIMGRDVYEPTIGDQVSQEN